MQIVPPGAREQNLLVVTLHSRTYRKVPNLNMHVFVCGYECVYIFVCLCVYVYLSVLKVYLSTYVYFSTELFKVVETVEFFSLFAITDIHQSTTYKNASLIEVFSQPNFMEKVTQSFIEFLFTFQTSFILIFSSVYFPIHQELGDEVLVLNNFTTSWNSRPNVSLCQFCYENIKRKNLNQSWKMQSFMQTGRVGVTKINSAKG